MNTYKLSVLVISALLPIVALGYCLLKFAEDTLIAEKVRADEQKLRVLVLEGEKMEKLLAQRVEEYLTLLESDRGVERLCRRSEVLAIRNSGKVSYQQRSLEVSQWLLDPDTYHSEISEWIKNERYEYAPAFSLFVLHESGLINEFPKVIKGLNWQLGEGSELGVPLTAEVNVLLDIEAFFQQRDFYTFDANEYDVALKGFGMPVGIRAIEEDVCATGVSWRQLLIMGCILWILVVFLLLTWYTKRSDSLAQGRLDALSVVGHELRTPLTGMKLLLERSVKAETEEVLPYLRQIECDRDRLEKVMEYFLIQGTLARRSMQLENVDWYEWMEEEFAYLKRTFSGSEILFECLETVRRRAFIDVGLMRVVLCNLVRNAELYGEGSNITIKVLVEDRQMGFEVIDFGPGMPRKLQKTVFKRYVRGDAKLERSSDGMGLGLSIVKEVIELHGGKVYLESALRCGTVVKILLPDER